VLWIVSWGIILHFAHSFVPGVLILPVVVRVSLAVGASAFLVAGLYNPIFRLWREEKAQAFSGELDAPVDEDRPDGSSFLIQIGATNDGGTLSWNGGSTKPIFDVVGSKMTARREGGKLLLSVDVRQRATGAVILSIVDNKWTVSSAQNVVWDKNYTRNALEVKDGRGRVVFQVILAADRIHIQGEWWHEDGSGGRVVRPFPYHRGEQDAEFILMTPKYFPDESAIEPIFKYPSKEYWGEFVDWFLKY
jgi:hypothetical protein